jgi:hypothetical protein
MPKKKRNTISVSVTEKAGEGSDERSYIVELRVPAEQIDLAELLTRYGVYRRLEEHLKQSLCESVEEYLDGSKRLLTSLKQQPAN